MLKTFPLLSKSDFMELKLFKQRFSKLSDSFFNTSSSPSVLQFELELYKKLWNFFLIGESYYFIINHHGFVIEFVSSEVETVMGYATSEYNIPFMNDILHPDDRGWFISAGERIKDFFRRLPVEKLTKYKVRYDARWRKKNGVYARLLYQGVMLEHNADGQLLRTLNVHTDITYLKQEGKPVLSFIGMDGEPSYIDVGLTNPFIEGKEDFTTREKEILRLLIEGRLSKEISDILHISKQTVDTHRKNMLHKKHLATTAELVGKSIRQGWI